MTVVAGDDYYNPATAPETRQTTTRADEDCPQMVCLMKNNIMLFVNQQQEERAAAPPSGAMTTTTTAGGDRSQDTFFVDEEEGGGGGEQAPLQELEAAAKAQQSTEQQSPSLYEENDGRLLPEDIYSLFYTSKPLLLTGAAGGGGGGAFLCSFLAIFGQIFLLVLILLDITDVGAGELFNPLLIPPGVPLLVNLAQFLGVILTVWFLESNGDLIKGTERFTEGYDERIQHVFPFATRTRWILSSTFQIIAGILMIVDLFILLMQSTTILVLCLNFAALHFVSDIPQVAFISASRGILTSSTVQQECIQILETKIPPINERYQQRIQLVRRIGMYLTLLLLYAGYFTLITFQWNGRYMCTSLYVQFGDSFAPEMAYYSGRFQSQGSKPNQRIDSRTYFVDETQTIQLAYCHKVEAWTFSKIRHQEGGDHCNNYIIKSIKTKTFDVTDLGSTSSWLSKHPVTNKDVPTDWLYLGCNECSTDTCEHGSCRTSTNNNNESSPSMCICDEGFMGRNCEFAVPSCSHLDIDLRSQQVLAKSAGAEFLLETGESGFRLHHYAQPQPQHQHQHPQHSAPGVGGGATTNTTSSSSSGILQLRYFPLYLSIESGEETHNFAVLAFVGRRWALFGRTGRDFFNTKEEYNNLIELFGNRPIGDSILSLRDSWFVQQYRPYFFSEPVDLSSKSFSLLPTGLDWYQAGEVDKVQVLQENHDHDHNNVVVGWYADEGQLTGAKIQCADCDPITNPCQNGGHCEVSAAGGGEGKCICPFSFEGTLCESAQTCNEIGGCMNNGTCNEYNYCECPHPFHGSLCQNYPTNFVPPNFSCTRQPCLNGGICNVLLGTCDCTAGNQPKFTGQRCEEEVAN